jgi:hypothetical protein
MVKKIIAGLLSVVILITVFSCASIVNGTKQDVRINSDPTGAQVSINGVKYTTPAVIKLKRGSKHSLTFTKEGYEPVTLKIDKKFNSWVFGNLIFGGVIGLIVDFSNGAAYKLSPDQVNAKLNKKQLDEFGINLEIDGQEYKLLIVDSAQLHN